MVFFKIKVNACILIHPINIYIWGAGSFKNTLFYFYYKRKLKRILQFKQHAKFFPLGREHLTPLLIRWFSNVQAIQPTKSSIQSFSKKKLPLFIHQHRPYPRPATHSNCLHAILHVLSMLIETITCDGILHVNMFQYLKTLYIICTFFCKFYLHEYIRPYFYRTLFVRFLPVTPRARGSLNSILANPKNT